MQFLCGVDEMQDSNYIAHTDRSEFSKNFLFLSIKNIPTIKSDDKNSQANVVYDIFDCRIEQR